MAKSSARTAGLLVEVIFVAAVMTACGSSTPVSQPAALQITGAASCPAAENQNLTFSGALTGHVSCSTSPVKCALAAGSPSLVVPLNASIGANPAQLVIVFRFFLASMQHDQPGTYAAGKLGDAQDSSLYGATLDGGGHWETPTPGGTLTLSTDDAAGASGALDIKLTLGDKTIAVVGTWRCVRP